MYCIPWGGREFSIAFNDAALDFREGLWWCCRYCCNSVTCGAGRRAVSVPYAKISAYYTFYFKPWGCCFASNAQAAVKVAGDTVSSWLGPSKTADIAFTTAIRAKGVWARGSLLTRAPLQFDGSCCCGPTRTLDVYPDGIVESHANRSCTLYCVPHKCVFCATSRASEGVFLADTSSIESTSATCPAEWCCCATPGVTALVTRGGLFFHTHTADTFRVHGALENAADLGPSLDDKLNREFDVLGSTTDSVCCTKQTIVVTPMWTTWTKVQRCGCTTDKVSVRTSDIAYSAVVHPACNGDELMRAAGKVASKVAVAGMHAVLGGGPAAAIYHSVTHILWRAASLPACCVRAVSARQ